MANRVRTGRTDGQDKRGNSKDRAARRNWLLSASAPWGGNGIFAPCALATETDCSGIVDYDTMEVDRIIPGALGGRYVRTNIRPACATCNLAAGRETQNAVAGARELVSA